MYWKQWTLILPLPSLVEYSSISWVNAGKAGGSNYHPILYDSYETAKCILNQNEGS